MHPLAAFSRTRHALRASISRAPLHHPRRILDGRRRPSALTTLPISWTIGYDSRDRIISFTPSTSSQVNHTLDANGNLTHDGRRTFTYDASNRLSCVTIGSSSTGSSDNPELDPDPVGHSYAHNALGQRVFKSELQSQSQGSTSSNAPSTATLAPRFVDWLKAHFPWLWDAGQTSNAGQSYLYADGSLPSWALLGEYSSGGSAEQTEYIWFPTEGSNAIPVGLYRGGQLYAIQSASPQLSKPPCSPKHRPHRDATRSLIGLDLQGDEIGLLAMGLAKNKRQLAMQTKTNCLANLTLCEYCVILYAHYEGIRYAKSTLSALCYQHPCADGNTD